MAITKQKKEELVTQYIEQLKDSQGVILTDYRGLTVGDMQNIRKAIRPTGGNFHVVKNRLLALALKEVGLSLPEEWLVGPTAIGFCHDEVPPVAKAGYSMVLPKSAVKGDTMAKVEPAGSFNTSRIPST